MKLTTNKKIILIFTVGFLVSMVIILSIFLTFNKNGEPIPREVIAVSSFTTKNTPSKSFDEGAKFITMNPIEITSKSSQSEVINSKDKKNIILSQGGDPLSKGLIPELPPTQKYEYGFNIEDKELLNKYIEVDKLNLNSRILSETKDDKNKKIIALSVPRLAIKSQTYKDFASPFQRTGEKRSITKKDRVFLYFTQEKRIAYMGEYIYDIQSFEFESQEYWLVNYYGELIISKPNFSYWRDVDTKDKVIEGISKKSSFEFVILQQLSFEDFDEFTLETISPQKYIIDGLFENYNN
jgi:hypothetical protein